MKISIIVPVYNVKKYIKRCILSLIDQDYDNYEVIVVNDGSTDGSIKIVEELSANCNKITIINQCNKGLGAARNHGIIYATGDYIAFVDSDDYVDERYLSRIVEKLSACNCDILIFNSVLVDDYGLVKKPLKMFDEIQEKTNVAMNPKLLLSDPAMWNKVYKKTLWDEDDVRFPEGVLYEDTAISRVLLERARWICTWDAHLYFYVQRKGSITNTRQIERLVDMIRVNEDMMHGFQKRNVYQVYLRELEYIAVITLLLDAYEKVNAFDVTSDVQTKILNFMRANYPECEKNNYLSESEKKKVKMIMRGDFSSFYKKYGRKKKLKMILRRYLPMWSIILFSNFR